MVAPPPGPSFPGHGASLDDPVRRRSGVTSLRRHKRAGSVPDDGHALSRAAATSLWRATSGSTSSVVRVPPRTTTRPATTLYDTGDGEQNSSPPTGSCPAPRRQGAELGRASPRSGRRAELLANLWSSISEGHSARAVAIEPRWGSTRRGTMRARGILSRRPNRGESISPEETSR